MVSYVVSIVCCKNSEKIQLGGVTIAYVSVPKDLTNVKTKFLFNLTKRQLICFGGGAIIGVPLFFILRPHTQTSTAAIVMAVFDVAQNIVNDASGIIVSDTSLRFESLIPDLEAQLEAMELGTLFGVWMQSFLVGICMHILTICIFLISFGRMLEIYVMTSVAPIPMANMLGRDSHMGQNYMKSLGALGLQAFLIIICVAIYAALVQNIAVTGDISYAIWTCMGYTVLLCFSLFKTGSMAKSILGAH